MKRPTKKEIQATVQGLHEPSSGAFKPAQPHLGKLGDKKTSQRIRKQGV